MKRNILYPLSSTLFIFVFGFVTFGQLNQDKINSQNKITAKNIKEDKIEIPLPLTIEKLHQPLSITIKDKSEINNHYSYGATILMYAAEDLSCKSEYNSIDIAKFLIQNGANINDVDWHGQTPLMYASRYGSREMIKFLIEKGADVNQKGPGGWTALMGAVSPGDLESTKILVEAGANLESKRDYKGWTVLAQALVGYDHDVVRYLVFQGANIFADGVKDKIMRNAIVNGDTELLKKLIELRADVNEMFEYHETYKTTMLSEAVRMQNYDIVKLLLDSGADKRIKNIDTGNTTACSYATDKDTIKDVEVSKKIQNLLGSCD